MKILPFAATWMGLEGYYAKPDLGWRTGPTTLRIHVIS